MENSSSTATTNAQSEIELFKDELSTTLLADLTTLCPVYQEDDSTEIKLNKTHRALVRSIRTKNRVLALTNAFFLGSLLSEVDSITRNYRRDMSDHYRRIAETVYDVFESNPSHLLYTTSISVKCLSKIKRSEVLQLRNFIQDLKLRSIFDGAQNLEEEDC